VSLGSFTTADDFVEAPVGPLAFFTAVPVIVEERD
jgi:hypothetical protein